jgi:uncharacterized protein YeaO (DUF488 family)
MILRASLAEIKKGSVTKEDGYLVVAMRTYPRFLLKSAIDDYKQSLSPQKELFEHYRELKKQIGSQNEAFERAQYQSKFALTPSGLLDLKDLVEKSKNKNVYLICQCEKNERCHVDLMLLIAKHKYAAEIGSLPFEYSVYSSRVWSET